MGRKGASNRDLAEWATSVVGEPIAPTFGKQFISGVAFCKLLDAAKPGVVAMSKVNPRAQGESDALANFKVLQTAFHKLGLEQPMDMHMLSKGQPQATLEMLTRIHTLHHGEPDAVSALAPLDGNAMGSRVAGRKRRGEVMSQPEKRTDVDEAAAPEPPKPSEAESRSREQVLEAQLAAERGAVRVANAEREALREERDFYIAKLELLDMLCQTSQATLPTEKVQQVLYASEDALSSACVLDE